LRHSMTARIPKKRASSSAPNTKAVVSLIGVHGTGAATPAAYS
jgi:hypothetical protein